MEREATPNHMCRDGEYTCTHVQSHVQGGGIYLHVDCARPDEVAHDALPAGDGGEHGARGPIT
eukprot:7306242-Pyramimonas_sp.AAC.1